MEHHFPGLADHPQTGRGFIRGELGATAVETVDAPLFQLAQAVKNRIQVVMHEPEEHASHHEAETRKGHHRRGIEITVTALRLELAPLLQDSTVKKFT